LRGTFNQRSPFRDQNLRSHPPKAIAQSNKAKMIILAFDSTAGLRHLGCGIHVIKGFGVDAVRYKTRIEPNVSCLPLDQWATENPHGGSRMSVGLTAIAEFADDH